MSFLLPLFALVVGILLGDYLNGPVWGLIPVAIAVCLYLFLLLKSKTPLRALKLNPVHHVWVFFLFLGVGVFASIYHRPQEFSKDAINSIIGAEGEVMDIQSFAGGDRLKVKLLNTVDKAGKISECRNSKIILNSDGITTKKGDIIVFKGKIYPIVDDPNYRSTGYADRMKREGYLYRSNANADNIKIKGFNSSFFSRSSLWRDRIEICLEKSSLDRNTVDFLIAFLLGDKSFITTETKNSFSDAGVAHVLALSGMHVAIVMGIFMILLFPFALVGLNRPRYWIAVIGIWIFAFLTGFAPSTFRACVMATFVVISLSFQRRKSAGNALLASCFVILLLDPSAIYNVGLQLSFLSVACILMFAAQLNPVNRHLHPKLHLMTSSVLVSLVATIGTWVLVSYYFKRIPLLFLPANLVILPFLPLYMFVAILYTAFLMFGIDLSIMAYILDMGYEFFSHIVNYIASIGNYTLDFKATLPVVVLWILGILILGYAINRRKKLAVFITTLIFLIGSVIIAPVLASSTKDSMIFQKKYRDISMVFYEGSKERQTIFPRNMVSRIVRDQSEIISVDCKGFIDSIPGWLKSGEEIYSKYDKAYRSKKKKRYLLLSSGFGDLSLKDIPGLEKFDKVILHSSIRKKREKALIEEAKNMGMSTIHSLRLDGPLEIEL